MLIKVHKILNLNYGTLAGTASYAGFEHGRVQGSYEVLDLSQY